MATCARFALSRNSFLRPLWNQCMQYSRSFMVGEPLPSVDLYEDTPDNVVNIRELFKGKKGVLFSVVGAFTPGCTQGHIPDFLDKYDVFKKEGFDMLCCVSVNDPFVMSAWGEHVNASGKIRMLADPAANFTKAMKMDLDCRKWLGNIRSKRYSIVVKDSVIHGLNSDPDHTGLACLLCIKNLHNPYKKMEPFKSR